MNKPTIIEALQARIPLPWKQSTCDGPPLWKVERQRPEDFTAEIYQRLKKYGMKEGEIRELFYVTNENWAKLKQQIGAVPPADDEESADKPKKKYKNCFPNAKKPVVESAHAPTDAEKEDVFRPADHITVDGRLVSLRDCAARLLAAINAREKADEEIAFYSAEIRRMA